VFIRREASGPFTDAIAPSAVLRLPIAHAEGRYQCDPPTLTMLEREERVAFRYCAPDGSSPDGSNANPNGSLNEIAGIYNAERNVLGLMPHPERASETILGSADGFQIFASLKAHLEGR
jgi:phosphoribosylformylglycinamidine synthase